MIHIDVFVLVHVPSLGVTLHYVLVIDDLSRKHGCIY